MYIQGLIVRKFLNCRHFKPCVEAASLQHLLPVGANEDEVVLHQVHQHLPDQLTHVHP